MRLPEAALGGRMMLSEKHPITNWKSVCASQGLGRIWGCVFGVNLGKRTGELGFSLRIVDSRYPTENIPPVS